MPMDRRRSKRYRLDLPVRFRIYVPSDRENATPFLPGQIHDLSEEGMRLLVNTVQSGGLHILHPTPTTSELCHLEIEILGDESPLTLQARVVWYDRTGEGQAFAFQAGVRFLDLTQDLKKQIQKVMRRSLSPT